MMHEKHFMGRDGFHWFIGKVVNRNDIRQLGRVQVRIFGLHPEDEKLVPDEHLPWAIPIQPVTSAGIFGIGQSPTGLLVGSYVFGFFMDGRDAQIPVIMGSIASSLGHYVYQAIDTVKDTVESVATDIASAIGDLAQAGPPVDSGPPNQEFWTLVALCASEAGTDGQDQCDVAQTIYNRVGNKSYGSKNLLGVMLAKNQYEPVWRFPEKHGPYKSGEPNDYWKNIKTANDAARATGKFSAQQMLQTAANLRNASFQAAAKAFVGPRTDFLGSNQPARKMTENGSKVQRTSRSNKIGFSYSYSGTRIAQIPSSVTNQGSA